MSWILVFIAGIIEVCFALSLKESDGFTRLWPSLLAVVSGTLSFVLLTLALRHLPAGTAYAVWTGIGAAGTVIIGVLFLQEPSSALRLFSVGLVLVGVIGLKLSSS
ncbi:MAG: multidrug efflux SMR transporter [Tepidiformaceae bacterium]